MASSLNLKPVSAASGKPSALASGRSKFSPEQQQGEQTLVKSLRHRISSALLGEKGSGLVKRVAVGEGNRQPVKKQQQENPVARLKLLLVRL